MTEPTEPVIYTMKQLEQIIDRRPNTIRIWELYGRLPSHLVSKRDPVNNRRFWTHEQVVQIIEWMTESDMRPGRLMSDPANESKHLQNLRLPKFLTGNQINGARRMAENGRSRSFILNRIYPNTKYSNIRGLERALLQAAKIQGWQMPPKTKPQQKKRSNG